MNETTSSFPERIHLPKLDDKRTGAPRLTLMVKPNVPKKTASWLHKTRRHPFISTTRLVRTSGFQLEGFETGILYAHILLGHLRSHTVVQIDME